MSKLNGAQEPVPNAGFSGMGQNFKKDFNAGFLVFLIALPLCLGISLACGYPAIAGIFTAVVGAIVTTFISNSQLTIKGPAAGLIVIAIGAVTDFGYTGGRDIAADIQAYRMALGVGVAAGCLQIIFGLLRVGSLGDFFPLCAVHGMLAAIGIIVILKQFPIVLGGTAAGEPFELMAEIPRTIIDMNPYIAAIGFGSLIIMFGIPKIKHKYKILQKIPPPMIVLFFAVPFGLYLGVPNEGIYVFEGYEYNLGKEFMVNVPGNMFKAIAFPDFSSLKYIAGWKWVIMFALIGSIESLLSAKAIDILDPWKRKTNLDRDLLAVGIGNTMCAFVGGMPMISEIVRSKANIDSGARTRFANMYHGLLLLLFVALVPFLLCKIPLAALAAMLVYTGFQLTAPKEFVHTYKIGVEQLVIFVTTLVAVLATDLVIGIAIGIGAKFFVHIINGVPIRSLFRPYLDVKIKDDKTVVIFASDSAVFSNWIPFRKQVEYFLKEGKNVILNMSKTKLIDHSVMGKLSEFEHEFERKNLTLEVVGLEAHQKLSAHKLSAMKHNRELIVRKHVSIVAETGAQAQIRKGFRSLDIARFASIEPVKKLTDTPNAAYSLVRIEALLQNEKADELFEYLREEILPKHPNTIVSIEDVEMVLPHERRSEK